MIGVIKCPLCSQDEPCCGDKTQHLNDLVSKAWAKDRGHVG